MAFDPRSRSRFAAALLTLLTVSCADEPRGGPRDATYPITGQLFIDGEPAAGVQVTCHPVDLDNAHVLTPGDFTDEEGRFEIGTYESGDGAPKGVYRLTFLAGQWNLDGSFGGPDKLGGRYDEPEESDVKVTVAPGIESDLGRIDLTTE